MQQLRCCVLPQQPLQASAAQPTGSRPAPPPPSLLPGLQLRRSERSVACGARKSRVDLAALEAPAASAGGGGGSPARVPLPPPHQQHAQPPHAGMQQVHTMPGSKLRTAAAGQQQKQRAKPAAMPPHGASTGSSNGGTLAAAAGTNAASGSQQPQVPAGTTSTAPQTQPSPAAPKQKQQQQQQDVQLIFKFERRGEGWGEEILPHLVVEQRPLEKKKKRAYSRPDPWKEGSLECYLVECGVPPEDVDRVVTQAVAWRVTPGGRSLIDRRRRSRVERNVVLVVEHLELECGVPFGPKGIAAILARCPEIMLCKPTTNDRWDRRAVELSAYLLRHGHCNVPEDWEENPELGLWVKRQRIARAAGQLSDERLSILKSMGFIFGEVAQLTEEWEHRFDQLVDWLLWHNENQQHFSWLGVDWGARGGITARELALWTTLQREYRARGLLPGEALSRFEAIGVQWDGTDGTPVEREWMSWFGRLLYVIERHNTQPKQRHSSQLSIRPKMGRPRGSGGRNSGSSSDSEAPAGEGAEPAEDSEDEDEESGLAGSPAGARRRGSAAVAAARLRLQADVAARRAALAAADLRSEPGLRFWLERQRRRWRQQELPAELELMLQLAGVQLDPYSPAEWQAVAHTAATLLQGSHITLGTQLHPAAAVQPRRRRPAQPAGSPLAGEAAAAAAQLQQQQPEPAQPQPAATVPPPQGPALRGSARLRAARWVQTQQALFAEGKLSPAQQRYMAFLGITWVLSEKVTHMAWPDWQQWCARLQAAPHPLEPHAEVAEWLQHQRGLHALGWLSARRRLALEAIQVRVDRFDRSPSDVEWDKRLSELLAFKAEHGLCQLGAVQQAAAPPPPATARQQQQQARRWAPLAAWLAEQHQLLLGGKLPAQRAAQLAAIGAAPAQSPAAVAPVNSA